MIFQIEFHMDYYVWNHKVNPFEARRCKQSSEMDYPVSRQVKLTDCTLRKEFLISRKATMEHFWESFKKNPFDCSPICKTWFMIKDYFTLGKIITFFRMCSSNCRFLSLHLKFNSKFN